MESSSRDNIEALNSDVSQDLNYIEEDDMLEIKSSLTTLRPTPPPEEISVGREILFLLCVALQQMLTQAGVAQTTNPSTPIAKQFGVEDLNGEKSWFTASYSLTVGTFILIAGRLGDMYGYKKMYLIGFAWFALWSLVVGFSGFTNSQIFFDVARALQGMGPALSVPNAMALIGHYYPKGFRKDLCMCLYGSVAPTGFMLGALFSGTVAQLVDNMALPGVFLGYFLMAIVCVIILVVGYFAIPENIGNFDPEKEEDSFDWLGSFFGVSGLVLINFAWNQGPNVGWDKPYVYVLLIVGFILIGLFFVAEGKVKDPLVPSAAFKGETGFVLGCIAAGWSCFGVWLYYTFQWNEFVDGQTAIIGGVHFVPAAIVGYVAAALTAVLLQKLPLSIVMYFAMLFFFVGIVLMGTRPVGQIYWTQKFFSLIIQSFGMDMSFPAATVILSNSLPKAQQGVAASLVATFQNYAISIGLGIAGTVEYYQTRNLPDSIETDIHGFRVAFYMGMGLAGCGVVLSLIFILKQAKDNAQRRKLEKSEKPAV